MSESVHFVPSRVEGLSDVESVKVFPDRVELTIAGTGRCVHFVDIAKWPWPAPVRRMLFRLGAKPNWLPVADRDWFHEPPGRFFVFYTSPPLELFMPTDESADHENSTFARIKQVILAGGFSTYDLG